MVTNLPQSAFQVFENGVPQAIKLFKREDVPVSRGLIIDNASTMSLEALVRLAQQEDVLIYAIGLLNVAHDIRNQYTIAYTPTNTAPDGTYRQIKLVVKTPGNPVARTRSGYYASDKKAPGAKKPSRSEG